MFVTLKTSDINFKLHNYLNNWSIQSECFKMYLFYFTGFSSPNTKKKRNTSQISENNDNCSVSTLLYSAVLKLMVLL